MVQEKKNLFYNKNSKKFISFFLRRGNKFKIEQILKKSFNNFFIKYKKNLLKLINVCLFVCFIIITSFNIKKSKYVIEVPFFLKKRLRLKKILLELKIYLNYKKKFDIFLFEIIKVIKNQNDFLLKNKEKIAKIIKKKNYSHYRWF